MTTDSATTPSDTTAAPGGPAATGTTDAPATQWTAGFDPDTAGYVQNKQWKEPKDLVTSYRNLEKLVKGNSVDSLVAIPKDDKPEAWAEVYDKLGRPKDPKGYELTVPREFGDEKFAEAAAAKFHEVGLTAKQARELTGWWNKHIGDGMQAKTAEYQQTVAVQMTELKNEWGSKYDANVKAAQAAAREFGLDAPTIEKLEAGMGFGQLMKFMHNIGSKIGKDDTFVSSENAGNGFGGMSKEAAAAERKALMGDKAWVNRWAQGDRDARKQMERLDRLIAG